MNKVLSILGLSLYLSVATMAQDAMPSSTSTNDAFNDWHLQDMAKDGVPGISATRAYDEILKNKKSTTVVVAIIDSGTETFHEDLRDNIWNNEDEQADNGQDDDKNGYVDDVHGWSFIGGPNGDVSTDNLEFTRILRDYKKRFANVTSAKEVASADKADYEHYQKMQKEYTRRLQEATEGLNNYMMVATFYQNADQAMKQALGKENYTVEEVQSLTFEDDFMKAAQGFILLAAQEGFASEIEEGTKHFESAVNYSLNLDYDPRNLVGDNYADVNERIYGNNHVDGPEAEHGTHVGGIVGAVRNSVGMNGVADNVKLMIIRCVPNGDERDKDVANSIRYAADNGARIINMSFGKSFSPQKAAVDAAIKYAESKGVLMIHAAGNDAENVDVKANFPKDKFEDGTYSTTWMEIGASGQDVNAIAADFSNYGKKSVDVFAPGVDIYSTIPGGGYKNNSGTSMAAPVASGAAAVLLSYYPQLSAADVKEILMKSATVYSKSTVIQYVERKALGRFFAKIFIGKKKAESSQPPARQYKQKKVKFSEYSVTGGVINLYEAVKLAETWKK